MEAVLRLWVGNSKLNERFSWNERRAILIVDGLLTVKKKKNKVNYIFYINKIIIILSYYGY
jgi:hypothetical protein